MEDFSSTGQLVTLGLVDSSIGAMAKGLALIDVKRERHTLLEFDWSLVTLTSYTINLSTIAVNTYQKYIFSYYALLYMHVNSAFHGSLV